MRKAESVLPTRCGPPPGQQQGRPGADPGMPMRTTPAGGLARTAAAAESSAHAAALALHRLTCNVGNIQSIGSFMHSPMDCFQLLHPPHFPRVVQVLMLCDCWEGTRPLPFCSEPPPGASWVVKRPTAVDAYCFPSCSVSLDFPAWLRSAFSMQHSAMRSHSMGLSPMAGKHSCICSIRE